jgi:hypothetical protein
MKEIASNPSNRFDAWILKQWKVLPTNPDFLNLTEEQKEYLWEDYLLDNPEIARKIENSKDEEFNKEWDDEKHESKDEEFEEVVDNYNKFIKDNNVEIQRSDESKRILAEIQQREQNKETTPEKVDFNDGDWEEEDEEFFNQPINDDEWEEVDD